MNECLSSVSANDIAHALIILVYFLAAALNRAQFKPCRCTSSFAIVEAAKHWHKNTHELDTDQGQLSKLWQHLLYHFTRQKETESPERTAARLAREIFRRQQIKTEWTELWTMHALASSLGIPSNEKHSKICHDPNWSVLMIRARLATGTVRILHGNWRNTAKRIDCELIQARNVSTVSRFPHGASTWFRQILFLVSALRQRQFFSTYSF